SNNSEVEGIEFYENQEYNNNKENIVEKEAHSEGSTTKKEEHINIFSMTYQRNYFWVYN
ncbi:14868_t:CDS:1, partial [Entrophospora sp. SA101]